MDIDAADSASAETTPDDPPADDPGGGRRRLPRRSRNDRYLGGVAGGIGAQFDIDPFIIRAAVLGSTLFTAYAANWVPVIPAVYTLLWLLMPSASGRSALRDVRGDHGRRETVAAAASFVVVAVMLTRPVFGIALALAALAWVLLADQPIGDQPAPAGPHMAARLPGNETTDATHRASWGRRRRAERGEDLVAQFAHARRRPRRAPALWPLTFGLLAIIAVGGFMADTALANGLDPAIPVNLALIVIGAVLMLSAWRGRALWTIVLALALLPAWVGFSVADIGRFPGGGSATYIPTAVPASGTLEYANGYGTMTIDLRQLPLADGQTVALDIGTTLGTVTVLAPPTTETVLKSKVGLGTTTVRGDGLGFYEYDREPHMDRTMIRRYAAHGTGCIEDFWTPWSLVVANHQQAGVDLTNLDPTHPDDVEAIVAAIGAAGYIEPHPIDDGVDQMFEYEEVDQPYVIIDDAGNEYIVADGSAYPVQSTSGGLPAVGLAVPVEPQGPARRTAEAIADRTWSYSADWNGAPCIAQPAAENPATIEIDATIGIGTLEIRRDDF